MPRNRRRAARGNKKKVQNSSSDSSSESDSDLENTLDSSSSIQAENSSNYDVEFFPSTKFVGAKKGYVFKNDDNGLGYYLDTTVAVVASTTTTGRAKTTETSNRKGKNSQHSSYDPRFSLPTTSEMQQLRQTDGFNKSKSNRVKSNMMELKIISLLKHVSIDYKALKDLEKCLFTLKKILNGMIPFDMNENSPVFQKCKGLHPLWKHHTKPISLRFEKPSRIDLVGSYLLHSIIKSNCNVDITVQIPNSCFVPKDVLDYRYHDKRRLYLSAIANELSKESSFSDIEIQGWREGNDLSKPILVFKLAADDDNSSYEKDTKGKTKKRKKASGQTSKLAKKFCIRIYPIISKDVFEVQKLNPLKGNLRMHKETLTSNGEDDDDEQQELKKVPTPRYNCSILEDIYMRDHLQSLHQTALQCKGFIGACQLLKVWLQRREMLHAPDTFNGFLISILASDLLNKKEINNNASAKQIFKKVIVYIAKRDFGKIGHVLILNNNNNEKNKNYKQSINTHLKSHDVVMLDSQCLLNLASRVSLDAYNELRYQAKLSHRFLKNNHGSSTYSFDPLFLGQSNLKLWSKYDVYGILPSIDNVDEGDADGNVGNNNNESRNRNKRKYWKQETLQNMHDVLSQALTDRARLIRVMWEKRSKNSWNCMQLRRKQLPLRNIIVGIILEKSTFARTLDRGPNAEEKEMAATFRKFWGEKSELRRFKDGSIVEATLWQNKYGNQYSVISQIIKYIFNRHLKYAIDDMQLKRMKISSNQLNQFLQPVFKTTSTSDDLFKRLRQTLDDLAIKVTSLETLPLRVTALQFISSGGRYTREHPPAFHPLLGNVEDGLKDNGYASKIIHPHEVMVSLESSGRWPDDLFAIQKVKTAFLCSLGASLRKSFSIKSLARDGALDIAYAGYAFRLSIICDHEKELLAIASSKIPRIIGGKRKFIFDNRVMVTQIDAEKRLRNLRLNTDLKIIHSNLIHSLQLRFNVYGEVVRLVKHWFHAKMLSDILSEEMIEIIVASLFVDPSCRPHEPPSSFLTGFLRFLELAANHEWEFEPLIVDIDDSISPNDIGEIEEIFEHKQEILTQQRKHTREDKTIFYVVTSYDRELKWVPSWMENNAMPSVYLKRFVALAKETVNMIKKNHMMDNAINAFKPPSRKDYDATIYLLAENIPCRQYPLFMPSNKNTNKRRKHKHINELKGSTSKFGQRFRVETYRNLSTKDPLDRLIFDFDPFTKYINKLRESFGNLAFFFRDSYKGHTIGIIWNPNAFEPSTFKVGACNMKMPMHDFDAGALKKRKTDSIKTTGGRDRNKVMVWPNQIEILEEIKLLGKGFVKCVKM